MAALVDFQIMNLGRQGAIEPFDEGRVNPASYNLGIGKTLLREPRLSADQLLFDMIANSALGLNDLETVDLSTYWKEAPYMVSPGEWVLVDVEEEVRMFGRLQGQVCLRSSAARAGWDHSFAGYVDPGYSGRLTLELRNVRSNVALPIYPGLQLVQIRIEELGATPERLYGETGRYQGATAVQACLDATVGPRA